MTCIDRNLTWEGGIEGGIFEREIRTLRYNIIGSGSQRAEIGLNEAFQWRWRGEKCW